MEKNYLLGNIPSLKSLRAFVLTAKYESVKDAASELNVTAPAVTHQIASLERQIDVQLFIRNCNSIKLTEDGRVLYDSIHEAFGQIVDGLNGSLRQKEAVLRISAQPSFAQLWITRHIGGFHEKHPNIKLELSTGIDPGDFGADIGRLRRLRHASRLFGNAAIRSLQFPQQVINAFQRILGRGRFRAGDRPPDQWQSTRKRGSTDHGQVEWIKQESADARAYRPDRRAKSRPPRTEYLRELHPLLHHHRKRCLARRQHGRHVIELVLNVDQFGVR